MAQALQPSASQRCALVETARPGRETLHKGPKRQPRMADESDKPEQAAPPGAEPPSPTPAETARARAEARQRALIERLQELDESVRPVWGPGSPTEEAAPQAGAFQAEAPAQYAEAPAEAGAELDQAAVDELIDAMQAREDQRAEHIGTDADGTPGEYGTMAAPPPTGGQRPIDLRDLPVDTVLPEGERASARGRPVTVLLALNSLLILVVLVAMVIFVTRMGGARPAAAVARQSGGGGVTTRPGDEQPPAVLPVVVHRPGASWAQAERAYATKHYAAAFGVYEQLLELAGAGAAPPRLDELFRLRMAQCLWKQRRGPDAQRHLHALAEGRSPIVRALASFTLAAGLLADGQFLQARLRAYHAASELGALDDARKLQAECDFLVGRIVTEKVLALYDPNQRLPWPAMEATDPFAGLSEAELTHLLGQGTRQKGPPLLGPRLAKSNRKDRWDIRCVRAPLVDVLNLLSGETGLDLEWQVPNPAVRQRAVTLCLREASVQEVVEVACGTVGLIGRFDGERIALHDPESCRILSAERDLWKQAAVQGWLRFCLAPADRRRRARAHYALGTVYEAAGDLDRAVGEYRIAGKKFADEQTTAPQSLLKAALLLIHRGRFEEARAELYTVTDQHADFAATAEAHVDLARAQMRAEMLDQALITFVKAYHMEKSLASQRDAAMGAGRCLARLGRYAEAEKWLNCHLALVKGSGGGDLAEAYALLAQSQLSEGKLSGAEQNFKQALLANPSRRQRQDVLLSLIRVHLERKDDLVRALGVLTHVDVRKLDEDQCYRYLMLSADLYRAMGLPRHAVNVLEDGMQQLADDTARLRLGVALAECMAEAQDLAGARSLLKELLPKLPAGERLWYEAARDLVKYCLAGGEADEAIVVAEEMLRSPDHDDIRQEVSRLLGSAHVAKKQFTKAARAYARGLDRLSGVTGP